MSEQDRLLEVTKELKGVESEIKYHRDEFKESIQMLSAAKKALAKENERLRELIMDMGVEDESSLLEGLSVNYRNDFEVDMENLGDEYIKVEPDVSKIRQELVDSEWTKPIPGVQIVKKPSLRVSPKE